MSNFISPAIQAMNLVRYIGDEVSRLGEPILTLECQRIQEIIGAPSVDFVQHLIEDLKENGTVKGDFGKPYPYSLFRASLTLDGWNQYEAEKRGKFQSNRGFIAMQFGDPKLDPFVKEVVKPAVKEDLGYDLVDMRDVARAGVIDNILRTQITAQRFLGPGMTMKVSSEN